MRSRGRARLALYAVCVATTVGVLLAGRPAADPSASRGRQSASPAAPPAATVDPARLWLAPTATRNDLSLAAPLTGFSRGVALVAEARYAEALPLVGAPALASTPLADYAAYFTGLIHLRLGQPEAARDRLATLRGRPPAGFLSEAAILAAAEAASALGDHAAAVRLYAEALQQSPAAPDDVWLRLARSAQAAGDRPRAVDAYARVYAEFPTSDLAATARAELEKLTEWPALAPRTERYRLERDRAERLFAARLYADARTAFEALRPHASGDDLELVTLRAGQCDYFARRYAAARDRLRPLATTGSRRAEARFYYSSTVRALGRHEEYERLTRELVDDFPDSPWAEEALNALASHLIVVDADSRADTVFRELLAAFPKGRYAERAAWKVGWWDYKLGRYQQTVTRFEAAATAFPRSDYRPAYMYWTARSYGRLGNRAAADAAFRAVIAAYGNSYYGRLSARRLGTRAGTPPAELPPAILEAAANPRVPPTAELIRLLLSLDLHDLALDEILHARRTWGGATIVDATLGLVYHRMGELREGITAMKRAYPQYLAAGSERLPIEILRVIFPLDFWPLIQKHAAARKLDPYLMAALIAQESTFDPSIRSRANAIGLMQILPSTGRRYARLLGIPRFSTAMLTRPETNIRIGMAYFSDLVRRFGRTDFALAGYNAGESRIAQWRAERPGLEADEFVDDVPFPETQNYLKRILGTAEDYRRIYGPGGQAAPKAVAPVKPPA